MYLDGKREKLAKGSEHLEGRYATGTPNGTPFWQRNMKRTRIIPLFSV